MFPFIGSCGFRICPIFADMMIANGKGNTKFDWNRTNRSGPVAKNEIDYYKRSSSGKEDSGHLMMNGPEKREKRKGLKGPKGPKGLKGP